MALTHIRVHICEFVLYLFHIIYGWWRRVSNMKNEEINFIIWNCNFWEQTTGVRKTVFTH